MSAQVSYGHVVDVLAKQCQHGSMVRTPRGYIYAPCGQCDACLYNKSVSTRLRLVSQRPFSRYCYFITLTFASKYVPKAKVVHYGGEDYCFEVRPREKVYEPFRDPVTGKVYKKLVRGLCMRDSFDIPFVAKKEYMDDYMSRADLSYGGKYPQLRGYVGYICQEDVSLFMKRLRFNIKNITGNYERIHYYFVSEYTPKTFRPHFHILLFFDSPEIAQNIKRIVCQSWRFGRTDCSAVRADAASYVAQYTNSFSRLPYVLRTDRKIRPRGRFSVGFGQSAFRDALSAASQGSFSSLLDGVRVDSDGESFKLYPRRSYEDQVFFRPASDGSRDCLELFTVLRYCHQELSVARRQGVSTFALVKRLHSDYFNDRPINRRLSYIYEFLNILNRPLWITFEDFYGTVFFSRLYGLFRVTSKFLRYHGIFPSYTKSYEFFGQENKLWSLIRLSQDYFIEKEKRSNLEALRFVEGSDLDLYDVYLRPVVTSSISTYDPYMDTYLDDDYQTDFDKFSTTALGQDCLRRVHEKVEDSVKHREINDLNLKFVQYDYVPE